MGKKWISKKGNLFLTIFFEMSQKKINFKNYAILNAYLIKSMIFYLNLTKLATVNLLILLR